jgi:hypothetical protein
MPGMSKKRRQERIDLKLCAYNLSCSEPLERGIKHTFCPTHRRHRTHNQRKNREDEKNAESPANDPNAAPPSPTRSPGAPTVSWDKLVWVSFPDASPLSETASLAIQSFPEDRESLGHDPWLTPAYSMTLRNTVIREDEGYYVHQGLVTLLALKAMNTISVVAHTWDWLAQQLRENLLSSSCKAEDGQPLRSILFLHWTSEEPTKPTLDEVFMIMRVIKHMHGASFRTYPNESEAWQQRAKLGDIRALDDIANDELCPPKFSYRPTTCYGPGPCKLRDCQKTVHKRTHSSSAVHVEVRERGERHQLTCDLEAPAPREHRVRRGNKPTTTKTPSKSSSYAIKSSAHWFHQELIPTLQTCEFRVLIVTEASEKGIRGRAGRVVAIAKTTLDQKSKVLAARDFQPEDLEPPLTRSDLVEFALFVFEQLRKREDSMIFFESLDVGARLDIGVAEMFFVNEITRWYEAHYFSHHLCAEPKTQICKAVACALSAYIDRNMRSTF